MKRFRFKQELNYSLSYDKKGQAIKNAIKQSWLKYSIYKPQLGEILKSFIENESVETTDSPNCNQQQPDKFHHYFVLKEEQIQVFPNLKDSMSSIERIIDLISLKQLVRDKFQGGIEDMGNFLEGFCFKLIQKDETTYVICADSYEEKQSWMHLIYQYLEKLQINSLEFNHQVSQKDGYWVIISDWSTCSVACGGGTQTLQRKCILPSQTAKNCEGKSILVKSCNTQECDVQSLQQNEMNSTQLPAIIKTQRISFRPQTYETCIIKEGDLSYIQNQNLNANNYNSISLLVRAVLNNKTFSVYKNDQQENCLFSENLDEISTESLSDKQKDCFLVICLKSQKQIELCGISGTYQTANEAKKEWLDQIVFFKENCQDQKAQQDLQEMIAANPLIRAKREALQSAIIGEKQNNFKDQESYKQIFEGEKYLKKYTQAALQALDTEIKYEQSQQLEEIKKEQREEKELRAQLEGMREKEECLEREFRQKEQSESGLDNQEQNDQRIQKLKENIQNLIMKTRLEQNKKLDQQKKIAEMHKQELLDQIKELKMRMATKLIKAKAHGQNSSCQNLSDEDQHQYCIKNFDRDSTKLNECKMKEMFCQVCCQNEFGNLYVKEKHQCLDLCDNSQGRWVWIPNNNVISK